MNTLVLYALDYISGSIHARIFKLGMKHLKTITIEIEKFNRVQACKLEYMHTIFLCALDHISGCIHARTFKLGMKNL